MAATNTSDNVAPSPIKEVQLEALVVMRIIKHATSASSPTTPVSGFLTGMDQGSILQITNSFPFPQSAPDHSANQDQYYQNDAASTAAAAPRSKSNTAYANEMIRYLREVNVDAQGVGWYTSTSMGSFINNAFIENQLHYQKGPDERTAALVFDVTRTTNGSLSLKAYRLSPAFITAHKEGKFTTESLQKAKFRYQDILVELPVSIHNSHLLTSFLHQLPQQLPKSNEIEYPASLDEIARDTRISQSPLVPNVEALDISVDSYLEKSCDLLLDSIENHQTEQNNFQYWQRALSREQSKITAWQQKRKAENASRAATKQPLLDENEWVKLFPKLPQEPSRLESLLIGRQIEQYTRQVDAFSATVSAKMFSVRSNLAPAEAG